MPKLRLVSTDERHSIELSPGETTVIGRSPSCGQRLNVATVSRHQAELRHTPKGLEVRDLESTNGTFLNGVRITEGIAQIGDVVTFGKVAFHVGDPSGGRPIRLTRGDVVPEATIIRQLPVRADGLLDPSTQLSASSSAMRSLEDSPAQREALKLTLLLEISKQLLRHQRIEDLLAKVVDITFEVMRVDRVWVLTLDPTSRKLLPACARDRWGGTGAARQVPRSITSRVIEERIALLIHNAMADERFDGRSILMQSVQSAMCAPLVGSDGQVLGTLYVDNLTAIDAFDERDLEFLAAFAGLTAIALENSKRGERLRQKAVELSNFQRYFAPGVAQQIAGQQGAIELGGEKRQVSVFFSDLRGFTSLSESMRPEELVGLLNEYFGEMVDIVFEHQGTLDKFIGDAIMALWGAPLAHPGDADLAMAAAIEMQRAVVRLNQEWREQGRPELSFGIGINHGEVFAGNIGSDLRLEYTVIGDAVNTASRLCSQAAGGEILVSEPFYRQLEKPPPAEALEPIALKGKSGSVAVYRIRAEGEEER